MTISGTKKKIVIDNYFKSECDMNTSIKEAFTKGFELGLKKAPIPQQKYGKWIERESGTDDKENGFETVIVCSYCDFPATTFYSEDCESRTQIRTHFCPNCGANMKGRGGRRVTREEKESWIPVNEKLPKNDEDVLICSPRGVMAVAYYHIDDTHYPTQYADLNETGWCDEEGEAIYFEPIAWMPLPTPYKPQEVRDEE